MAWTRPLADPSRHPREGDDRAVSPVVGMILVLAVSTMGVLAVLYWGVPTVADMKSDAEFQAVANQFRDLSSNIDKLTRGTPGETAKRWRPSFERGAITFEEDDQRWILGTDIAEGTSDTHDWAIGSAYDTDNNVTIANLDDGPTAEDVFVDAWELDAGVETDLNVSSAEDCSSTSTTDDMGSAETIDRPDAHYFCIYDQDGKIYPLDGETVKFEVTDTSDNILARFYLLDVGSIHYSMTLGPTGRDAYHTNGAVVEGKIVEGDQTELDVATDPPFGPPRDAGDTTRFFGRLVEFQGQGSFGGSDSDRFKLLMSLYSTDVIEDHEDVQSLKVWIDGTTQDAWYEYLTLDGTDYNFTEEDPGDVPPSKHDDPQTFVEMRPNDPFDLKLVQSIVDLKVN
jgi:hypothetical protein